MITSLARQSIILKCLRQKSVLVGNYEFYYLAGLLKKLYGLELNTDLKPLEMSERILSALPGLQPKDEKESYLLKIVEFYEPLDAYDDQMKELFAWGEAEPDLWSVTTTHNGTDFLGTNTHQ